MKQRNRLNRTPSPSQHIALPLVLASTVVATTGCSVIGSIFKAGVFVGVASIVGIVALLIWGLTAALR
jgi:hypothetical protein